MSYRHIHCVYCKIHDRNSLKCYCILNNTELDNWYKRHCSKAVFRPSIILSQYLKLNNMNKSWEDCDYEAKEYLEEIGLNDYGNWEDIE